MSRTAHFIAADLGASSGRVMLGEWDGRAFSLRELHRFSNGGIRAAGILYWDILNIWSNIQAGLRKYQGAFAQSPQGIAADAWGVDFALLDRCGHLAGNPVHYRDASGDDIPGRLFEVIPERTWFAETGVQTMPINTLFRLHKMARAHDPALDSALTMLMIPDLCTYLMCGETCVERSEASTTQIVFDPARRLGARPASCRRCTRGSAPARDTTGNGTGAAALRRAPGVWIRARVSCHRGGVA